MKSSSAQEPVTAAAIVDAACCLARDPDGAVAVDDKGTPESTAAVVERAAVDEISVLGAAEERRGSPRVAVRTTEHGA